MNFTRVRLGLATIVLSTIGLGVTSFAVHATEFSFTATNSTSSTITQILVSENQSDWAYFDIGSGIRPGSTANLVWDQSTNSESCAQWVKATYADGSESEPAKFDFCENGLELEF